MVAQVDMSICVGMEVLRISGIAGASYTLIQSTPSTLLLYKSITGGPRLIIALGTECDQQV
jgi:hypothetical protein